MLVTGESGTGKELVAEAIHRNSRRKGGPFVKVNLGGIATTLFESEMFGHVKGAFTDARADRKGRFELADGGTVFLDEIGEVEPAAQVKLLRVLQDRTYEVLGSSTTRTVDVRVVSATNRDLGEMVARGQFREDLLYRLNLISVHLPALRERPGDVPLLVHRFLSTLAQAYGRESLAVSPAAMRWLAGAALAGQRAPAAAVGRAGRAREPPRRARARGPRGDGGDGGRGGSPRRPAPRGQHDPRRDRAGHDREVAQAPRRATSRGWRSRSG